MKTTIDIPENELRDAMRFSNAATKRDAVVTALADYNRRQRMAALTKHLGTCEKLITPAELKALREAN
jgi:hypothetical protein